MAMMYASTKTSLLRQRVPMEIAPVRYAGTHEESKCESTSSGMALVRRLR